jgi:hypothetical protein
VSVYIEEVIGLGVNDFIEGGVRFQKQVMFPKLGPKHRGGAVLALCTSYGQCGPQCATARYTVLRAGPGKTPGRFDPADDPQVVTDYKLFVGNKSLGKDLV